MAMTAQGPALAGPFESAAADLSGKEGYACKISGTAGNEVVTLAVVADANAIGTGVGVITSVAGSFADGTQTATGQCGGVAYALTGANVSAGAPVAPNGDSEWIPATNPNYATGFALQGGTDGDLILISVLGVSGVLIP